MISMRDVVVDVDWHDELLFADVVHRALSFVLSAKN
jgi:hypothetical protein